VRESPIWRHPRAATLNEKRVLSKVPASNQASELFEGMGKFSLYVRELCAGTGARSSGSVGAPPRLGRDEREHGASSGGR
jgi:hypothetical protein